MLDYHIYNIYYLFIKYWFVHFESNMFCSFSFVKNTLARWHTGILNRSIASKGLPKPPWSTLSLNIACCEGTWCKVKAMHSRRQKTISACACRIDFVASRVAKRHMRRSRERRVTTCYNHCMALIDLIVSHTTHMTSYDHQNVISRYRIWCKHNQHDHGSFPSFYMFVQWQGTEIWIKHEEEALVQTWSNHTIDLKSNTAWQALLPSYTLYPAPWKSVQNSSRSLESRADLSCAMLMIAYV